MRTEYYCPVVGCKWTYREPDQTFDLNDDMLSAVIKVKNNLTETVLTNHVISEHTVFDFLSSMRSYQTFIKVLGGRLDSVTDTPTNDPELASQDIAIRARRGLADELRLLIISWRQENNAR